MTARLQFMVARKIVKLGARLPLKIFIMSDEAQTNSLIRCSGLTDLFFSEDAEEIAEAKEICKDCPFREACLENNLKESYGVWGGEDVTSRRRIRRQRAKNTEPKIK